MPPTRIWELDALRAIALLLMISFHLIVDLHDFYQYPIPYEYGVWFWLGKAAASLFIILAGISASLNPRSLLPYGLRLLGWGLVITLVTYWYLPSAYIRFGILHFLGTALLLAHWLRRLPLWCLLLGVLLPPLLTPVGPSLPLPQPLGLMVGYLPPGFSSIDYYPLLPWFSLFSLGLMGGRYLYRQQRPLLSGKPLPLLPRLGRHTLSIYLLHQPILLALLYLGHRVW